MGDTGELRPSDGEASFDLVLTAVDGRGVLVGAPGVARPDPLVLCRDDDVDVDPVFADLRRQALLEC